MCFSKNVVEWVGIGMLLLRNEYAADLVVWKRIILCLTKDKVSKIYIFKGMSGYCLE